MSKRNKSWNLAALLVLSGCASSAGQSSGGAVCDPSPEPLVSAQALVANGHEINGIQMNGRMQNGMQLNGKTMNGIQMNGIQMNGTQLAGVAADGSPLTGADFVGTTLTGVLSDGSTIALDITAYTMTSGIAYYTLEASGQPICEADGGGIFVPGAWDSTGARHDTLTFGGHVITAAYSCTDGAIGKCVIWGYDPSKVGADLHQSCTRMVRADYCGTGVSFTKDGTLIDVFDTLGVQTPTTGDPSLLFEAAWTTTGAACVSRTRYEEITPSGDVVLPSCWASLPTCASWGEAQGQGAILGNASRFQTRSICP